MDEQGHTLETLAEKSGVSLHTIFRATSKGKIPRGPNIEKLASSLGVTAADLFAAKSGSIKSPATSQSRPETIGRILATLESMSDQEVSALMETLEAGSKTRSRVSRG